MSTVNPPSTPDDHREPVPPPLPIRQPVTYRPRAVPRRREPPRSGGVVERALRVAMLLVTLAWLGACLLTPVHGVLHFAKEAAEPSREATAALAFLSVGNACVVTAVAGVTLFVLAMIRFAIK